MVQMWGPSSSHPSSASVATTTATGSLACFPLPLSGLPVGSFLEISCCQTPSSPATDVGVKNIRFAHPWMTSAGTTTSGSSGRPGTARIMPARHLLELNVFPDMARATAVLTFFVRYPGAFVNSAPYIPPAMSKPPTSLALLKAPTGNELILVALPPILPTLSLRTFTLFGPPRVASTPRSLAENETAKSSANAVLNAALTAFLASGPTARMTVLVVWSFWPICPQPLLGHSVRPH